VVVNPELGVAKTLPAYTALARTPTRSAQTHFDFISFSFSFLVDRRDVAEGSRFWAPPVVAACADRHRVVLIPGVRKAERVGPGLLGEWGSSARPFGRLPRSPPAPPGHAQAAGASEDRQSEAAGGADAC